MWPNLMNILSSYKEIHTFRIKAIDFKKNIQNCPYLPIFTVGKI